MSFAQLRRLGEAIERAWRAIDYDVDSFPRLAHDQLAAAELDAGVDFSEVVAQLLHPETALLQEPDFGFSDLPLVPYRGACFHLQLLVWASGSMAVHQHPFAGAFRVLGGSSVAATFSVHSLQRVSQQLRVVRVETDAVELLATGDCRLILPGAALTHAVYHTGLPSVTLVARSHHVPWTADDQVLFRPSILLDARLDGDPTLRMLDRTLDMVAKVAPDQLVARVQQAFEQLDAARGAWLARRYALPLGERWPECLEPLRARHPLLAEQLLLSIQDMQARALVRRAREITTDEEVRFLLAAMLVATTQGDVYRLVARRFPGPTAGDGTSQTHALLDRAPPMVLYPWQHMLKSS